MKLSDNHYQRECYLKHNQVPTQSVMKSKMSPSLANVYFNSMSPKIKVLAGLEPPMKGGGSDWHAPPDDLLAGTAVLRPQKKEHLAKLSFNGIDIFGKQMVAHHNKTMKLEEKHAILDSDINWKKTIEASCRQLWEETSRKSAKNNTEKIQSAFRQFATLYTTSISRIENLLFEATVEEIKRIREEAHQRMTEKYRKLLKQQATMLYDRYTKKLNTETARLKAEFIEKLQSCRTRIGNRLHDINVEKHVAIEKLRHLLQCQNLACQVYVALKEREACQKEMDLSNHEHEKKAKALNDAIHFKDFEIRLAKEKEQKHQELDKIWQKKVCQVVKKFQMFVSYCLNSLPEHADFFLDMEKLMMLQLSAVVETPSAESIFEVEEGFKTPTARPHPFYLFCDKGFKSQLDQDLCPKHCTSSASRLPVVVVNKRCIYAACDNFEMFTDKIKQYILTRRDDSDSVDTHDYTHNIPVTYTQSQQLTELKLESSIMQILQQEHTNLKQVETECCSCSIPYCFCNRLEATRIPSEIKTEPVKAVSLHSLPSENKIVTRKTELVHEREPKIGSYMDYVDPKCKCAKAAKKNLQKHIPAYMRNVSVFDELSLPHYEPCSVEILKKLVKEAQGKRSPLVPVVVPSRTREVGTQYSDQAFEQLCTCLSVEEIDYLPKEVSIKPIEDLAECSSTFLKESPTSFATNRAMSLRQLLGTWPDMKEIFKKTNCD